MYKGCLFFLKDPNFTNLTIVLFVNRENSNTHTNHWIFTCNTVTFFVCAFPKQSIRTRKVCVSRFRWVWQRQRRPARSGGLPWCSVLSRPVPARGGRRWRLWQSWCFPELGSPQTGHPELAASAIPEQHGGRRGRRVWWGLPHHWVWSRSMGAGQENGLPAAWADPWGIQTGFRCVDLWGKNKGRNLVSCSEDQLKVKSLALHKNNWKQFCGKM